MRSSGVCPRFLSHEFRARTTYGATESTTLIDWPLTLAELEPYYDKAEEKMGVSGTNGLPPSAENNNFKVLKAGAERIGFLRGSMQGAIEFLAVFFYNSLMVPADRMPD